MSLGRMFPASPAVTTADRDEPRKRFGGKKPAAPPTAGGAQSKPTASTAPSRAPQKPLQTTVEEVEDDEAPTTSAKKKKKKPKKKKKSASATQGTEATPETPAPAPAPASPVPPPAPAPATKTPASPAKPTPAPKAKATAKPAPPRTSINSSTTTLNQFGSTTSLPLQQEQTAQSARTYLKTEGLAGGKTKVKTRSAAGNLGNLDAVPEQKKTRIFSRFSKNKAQDDDSDSEDEGKKSNYWTGKIKKKTAELVHQLLRTSADKKQGIADMRWEKFVRVRTCVIPCYRAPPHCVSDDDRPRIHLPPWNGRLKCPLRPSQPEG